MSWHAIQRTSIAVCVFILVFSSGVSRSFGQTGTTSLRGEVTDKSGAAIVGATIALRNAETGLERKTTSGNDGAYEFLALPPGTYSVMAEKENFKKRELPNVQLLVNLPATLNLTLEVGSTMQTV